MTRFNLQDDPDDDPDEDDDFDEDTGEAGDDDDSDDESEDEDDDVETWQVAPDTAFPLKVSLSLTSRLDLLD